MPADPKEIAIALQAWAIGEESRLKGAFAAGGHHLHGGDRWMPLAGSTIEAKGSTLPLLNSGRLANSIFVKVSGVVAIVGSNSRIAVYHQNGTRSIPQRKIIEVTKEDIERLKFEIKRRIETP